MAVGVICVLFGCGDLTILQIYKNCYLYFKIVKIYCNWGQPSRQRLGTINIFRNVIGDIKRFVSPKNIATIFAHVKRIKGIKNPSMHFFKSKLHMYFSYKYFINPDFLFWINIRMITASVGEAPSIPYSIKLNAPFSFIHVNLHNKIHSKGMPNARSKYSRICIKLLFFIFIFCLSAQKRRQISGL